MSGLSWLGRGVVGSDEMRCFMSENAMAQGGSMKW